MAKKTNQTVTGKNGKTYRYQKIHRKVGTKITKDGREISEYKYFTGKTKKEAEEKFRAYMESRNRTDKSNQRPFGEMLEEWFYAFLEPDDNHAAGTKARYFREWEKHMKEASISEERVIRPSIFAVSYT